MSDLPKIRTKEEIALLAHQSHTNAVWKELLKHNKDDLIEGLRLNLDSDLWKDIEVESEDEMLQWLRNYMCFKQQYESMDRFIERTMILDDIFEAIRGRSAYD